MSIADDIFGTIDKGNEDDLISAIDKFFESKDIDIKTELHAKEIKLLLQIKIYSKENPFSVFCSSFLLIFSSP